MNKKYIAIIVGIATVATIGGTALAMTASAATSTATQSASGQHKGGVRKPGVMGTVSAVNGNSITVTSKKFTKAATGTTPTLTTVTYTVDATNATVTKSNAASTVSNIAVGDTVMIQGTVSGTNVTATAIRDGQFGNGQFGKGGMQGRKPGVVGTVSAISGNSITVTSKARPVKGSSTTTTTATPVTYTVDATNATVTKSGATSSVSAIAVGDTLMVQGTVSGTNVTATAIRDGVMTRKPGTSGTTGVHTRNGVMGTVSAVNGTTLTVTSKARPNRGSSATATVATPITYTVDASSATVTKSGTASSVSAIVIGDTLMVRGTVSGTNVTAKTIMDGMPHFTKPASN
jgi:hypothetical protein